MSRRPFALVLLVLLAFAARSTAASVPRSVTMNFKGAEIEAVVQFISELTGKNFILDEKVRGKVTVISPGKITPDEAYEVFQAILHVKGFTIVPAANNVYKIVATREAKQTNIETVEGDVAPGDRFVTRILPLKHVAAETVAGILAPLVSKDSSIVAYAPTNTLIITDAYSNITRLAEIIQTLDVETVDTAIEIIHLQYAAAETLAKNVLQAITDKGSARTRRPSSGKKGNVRVQAEATTIKVIPDSRTNTLIVIAAPDVLDQIKAIVRALDVEIPQGSGKINVYYLKYADAENVASVLTTISRSAGTKAKPGQKVKTRARVTQVPVEFSEPVQITADKATNSLVIIASPQDYDTLKSVIQKLDIRRPQVLVEALIVEMDYNKSLQLGVEWRSTNDPASGGKTVIGGTNFGQSTALATQGPFAVGSGLFLAAVDGTITFAGQEFLNVAAFVRALQTQDDVNILSTPSLLTTDNEEAEIVVSDTIPFQTSEKYDNNGNPIYTFEYRDVGLTLRLTPQINEDNYVKLKLFQEISKIISTSTGTRENAPTTAKRSTKTTVVVKDGATIVIGGLVQDDTTVNASSVPCLGDLPVVGVLFRSTTDERKKTNLLIFLTPHIINEMADIEAISERKRKEFEAEAQAPKDRLEPMSDRLHRYLGPPSQRWENDPRLKALEPHSSDAGDGARP